MAKKKMIWWKAALATLLFASAVYTVFYHHKVFTRYYYKAYRLMRRLGRKSAGMPVRSVPFPSGYGIHGVDVSHYQEDINWGNLRTVSTEGDTIEFTFAFMKATEGSWAEDPAFDANWEDAHAHHITCGAYHYFLPDKDPQKQAENFISSVNLKSGDLPPVIDIEQTRGLSKTDLVRSLKVMAAVLEQHYGIKPIIYSNINFIEDYLSDDFTDYYFWVAHYYQEDLAISQEINWLFWQHNNHATLFGDDHEVDVNVFNGNIVEFHNQLLQSGSTGRQQGR